MKETRFLAFFVSFVPFVVEDLIFVVMILS